MLNRKASAAAGIVLLMIVAGFAGAEYAYDSVDDYDSYDDGKYQTGVYHYQGPIYENDIDTNLLIGDATRRTRRGTRGRTVAPTPKTTMVVTPPTATCTDGVKNQDESDVDCGGNVCDKCVLEKTCASDNDCLSAICSMGICEIQQTIPVTCKYRGDVNGDGDHNIIDLETIKLIVLGQKELPEDLCCVDINNDGEVNIMDMQMITSLVLGKIQPELCPVQEMPSIPVAVVPGPTCFDDLKNGAESDVDCGGNVCSPCTAGKTCNSAADCLAGCTNGVCDKSNTGDECLSDADCPVGHCSSNICKLVENGLTCQVNDDCISGNCKAGICQAQPKIAKEVVKCVFLNSNEIQKCYTTDGTFSCSGEGACNVDVSGEQGTELTWKSSCGSVAGYAYTVIDGTGDYDGRGDYAEFECPEPEPICVTNQGLNCNRNRCGGTGTVQCDGTCSSVASPMPTNFGQACNRNQCGGTGAVKCDGTCSSSAPYQPSNYGQACGCGGTIQCSGQCNKAKCSADQTCTSGQCVDNYIVPNTQLHRFFCWGYNHFYTNSKQEGINAGCSYEGTAAFLYDRDKPQPPDSAPFYRWWCFGSEHFYSTNYQEGINAGCRYENNPGFILTKQKPNTYPLHRFFNGRDHFYTKHKPEGTNAGYTYEGIAGYTP